MMDATIIKLRRKMDNDIETRNILYAYMHTRGLWGSMLPTRLNVHGFLIRDYIGTIPNRKRDSHFKGPLTWG